MIERLDYYVAVRTGKTFAGLLEAGWLPDSCRCAFWREIMKPFLFIVIYRPNSEEKKKGAKDDLIVPLSICLAADEGAAKVNAAFDIPKEYRDKLDRVEVVVRPF